MRRAALLAVGLALVVAIGLAWLQTGLGTGVSLIVTGGTVITMDGEGRVIPNGAVAVYEGDIVAVGTADEIAATYSAPDVIDATDQIILPGLINTHTHAPMVLFRGLADDLALMDWLNNYIFPAEKAMVSEEFVRVGTALAALEMIESGTTTFADMYYFEEVIAEATRDAGLRAVLGQTIIRFPVADAATPEDALDRAEEFLDDWADDELVIPAVAPHAPYTLTPETLRAARALADKYNAPLLIHLAETIDERDTIEAEHKQTPAAFLDGLGLWNGRALAAHGVWLEPSDIEMLAARGVGLSHNPESNMKLASGTASVPAWIEAGIHAGLGTDGAASNNDLDMFEAMRTAALLHKNVAMDPTAMPARLALEMATRRGAQALGLGNKIGSLEPGKIADIIVVNVETAHTTPMFDPISHIVYAAKASDVRHSIVQGRLVMRNKRVMTMNKRRVLEEARAMGHRVAEAVRSAR
ncbi:MAG: amidohydrolase family protein [Vicinamibacterales bacterium]